MSFIKPSVPDASLDLLVVGRIRDAFLNGSPIVPLCRANKCGVGDVLAHLPIRMAEFAISIRHVLDYWPSETFDKILRARDDYDAGFIDMAQAKLCNHFVLYSMPRKRVDDKRRRYFANMTEIW